MCVIVHMKGQIKYLVSFGKDCIVFSACWIRSSVSKLAAARTFIPGEITDGQVVRAGVSVTWNVLSWSWGHEFEPWSGRTWCAWYFCPKLYLNQNKLSLLQTIVLMHSKAVHIIENLPWIPSYCHGIFPLFHLSVLIKTNSSVELGIKQNLLFITCVWISCQTRDANTTRSGRLWIRKNVALAILCR